MNKLFRLKNKSRNFFWIIAESIDEAKDITVQKGFAKNVSNLSEVSPPRGYTDWIQVFVDQGDDVSEIYKTKGRGAVAANGQHSTWIVE